LVLKYQLPTVDSVTTPELALPYSEVDISVRHSFHAYRSSKEGFLPEWAGGALAGVRGFRELDQEAIFGKLKFIKI
jgi:hypothetical protein